MQVACFALKRHAIRCLERYSCTGPRSVRFHTHQDRLPLQTFLSNPCRHAGRGVRSLRRARGRRCAKAGPKGENGAVSPPADSTQSDLAAFAFSLTASIWAFALSLHAC